MNRFRTSCLLALSCLSCIGLASPTQLDHQHPLAKSPSLPLCDPSNGVPGTNNATYGPVPKEDQLFEIECLEIAPSPLPLDQIFFVLLRGEIPARHSISDADLATATLSITLSATYSDGEVDPPQTYTVPLKTETYLDTAHIAVRNATGTHVEYLNADGMNDILADFMIVSIFVRTGDWKFGVAGELADGRSLFALEMTQFLKGRPGWS